MNDAIIGLTIDRSGSMDAMWNEAVGGFNTFKNEQAANDGHAWIILNYFDQVHGQKYYAWDAKDIPDLGERDPDIHPRGMTALVDSTIKTVNDVDKWLGDNPWFDGDVFVVVITDGLENASEARPETLKELIQDRESRGWKFVYLAANVDTEATRKTYGFARGQTMSYDPDSVTAAYSTLSTAVTRTRSQTGGGQDAELFTEDERDVTNP